LLASLWGTVISTRMLRGEEDAGRWDLLLAEPLQRARSTVVHLAVLTGLCVALASVVVITFVADGSDSDGALVYGSGLGLLALTFVGVDACASQVFGNRRLAVGVAGAVLGAAMVLRIAADASDDRAWLRWLTPFGWLENLQAFDDNNLVPLVLLVLAPCVLLVVAVGLLGRRDVGEGLVRASGHAESRTALLAGPLPFAWRQNLVGVTGWSVGMALYGLVIGAITAGGAEFVAQNPSLEQLLADFGLTGLSTPEGFVASMAGVLAVAFTIQAASGLGRCHEDETGGRLDLPYAASLTRARWLLSVVVAALAAAAVAVVASIVATWVGAVAGDADLALSDIAIATLNALPATALCFGLAVLLLGTWPGLTVPLAVGAAIGVYIMSFLGPLLDWPTWMQDLNPFQQLGNAPVSPVDWTVVATILGIAAVEVILGFLTYQRRDLG
jgi:polyether ionophore transport system permease protein